VAGGVAERDVETVVCAQKLARTFLALALGIGKAADGIRMQVDIAVFEIGILAPPACSMDLTELLD
jgi:hypothetical protein